METARTKKKARAGRILFWVLSPVWLALLLSALLFAALNLLDFPVAKEAAMFTQTAMSPARRFRFHAAEGTVDIAMEPADAVFALKQYSGFDLDAAAAWLRPHGLVIEGYGVDFSGGRAALNVQLRYRGFLKIPLRAEAEIAPAGGGLTVTLGRVLLTRILPIPQTLLATLTGVSPEALTFTIRGEDLHPVLNTLEQVRYADGKMLLTCRAGEMLYREVMKDPRQAETAARVITGVPALTAYDEAAVDAGGAYTFGAAFSKILEGLETDPGSIERVRGDCLALAAPENAAIAFSDTQGAYTARFLPELKHPATAKKHDEIAAETAQREALLAAMAANLYDQFSRGELLYAETGFVRAGAEESLLTAADLVEDFAPYASFLDPAGARIVLCYGGEAVLHPEGGTPVKRLKLKQNAVLQGLDPEWTVLPLLMIRLANGRKACIFTDYSYDPPKFTVDTISDATYERYMQKEYLGCEALTAIVAPK